MIKIVVTGATGLIGSALVKKLMLDSNNQVVAIGRSDNKIKEGFKDYLSCDNFDYAIQDFSGKFNFRELINKKFENEVDIVFHAAGAIASNIIRTTPLEVIKPNINALENIFDYVIGCSKKTRVIVFSSATVYSPISETDISVNETDTQFAEALDSPTAAYSESKRMVEVITRAYVRQYDINAVIVRPSYVYGDTYFKPNTAFYSFLDKIKKNENIIIEKSGLPPRDNIYIDDLINGLLICAEFGTSGEAYNISSNGDQGNFVSIDEIALKMIEIANKNYKRNIILKYKDDFKKKGVGIRLNNAKLKQLNWSVGYSLEEGLMRTIESYMGLEK